MRFYGKVIPIYKEIQEDSRSPIYSSKGVGSSFHLLFEQTATNLFACFTIIVF